MGRIAGILTLLFVFACAANAQDASTQQPGSISGKVTIDAKPAANVNVRLAKSDFDPTQARPLSVTTDAEGKYEFSNVPPGRYFVSPYAPSYVGPNLGWGYSGAHVTVAPGESVTKVDVALEKGAVVTGKVTDAEGRPVIKLPVYVMKLPESGGEPEPVEIPNMAFMATDDRGIYRLFGVPPGRYVVGTGKITPNGTMFLVAESGKDYPLTFAPGTSKPAEARVLEISAGSENAGIDIALGRKATSFSVAGRVEYSDPETRTPTGTLVLWGLLKDGQRRVQPTGIPVQVDSSGAFRIDGLTPGNYGAFVFNQQGSTLNGFSDTAYFRVSDSDVTDVVIRMLPGATISGQLVMENVTDEKLLQKLSKFRVAATVKAGEGEEQSPIPAFAEAATDGSFSIGGIKPGLAKLYIYDTSGKQSFSIVRVEREGVPIDNSIQVNAGDTIGNVRVILQQGTGAIRGQITFVNGKRPTGYVYIVLAERPGTGMLNQPAQVDERGNFLLESLPPGPYTVFLRMYSTAENKLLGIKGDLGQTVTVTSAEATVKLEVNLENPEFEEVQP